MIGAVTIKISTFYQAAFIIELSKRADLLGSLNQLAFKA